MAETAKPDDLSCRELVDLVNDYLEGALPREERTRFEYHLVYCEGCELYLDQMRRTIETVGRLHEDDADPAALDGLLDAFRGWRRAGA